MSKPTEYQQWVIDQRNGQKSVTEKLRWENRILRLYKEYAERENEWRKNLPKLELVVN
jgi:hypothetical protein